MSDKAEQKITQYLHEAFVNETLRVQTLSVHVAVTPAGRFRDGLELHLDETRDHVRRIARHLAKREASRGVVQAGLDVAQGVVGQVLAIGKLPLGLPLVLVRRGAHGEELLLKNARQQCAAEAAEIATYSTLEQLALAVDDQATARLAASIRKEEERMLARLFAELPKLAFDVALADINGEPQFDLRRIGVVDAARSAAARAARRVARTATLLAARSTDPSRSERRSGSRTTTADHPRVTTRATKLSRARTSRTEATSRPGSRRAAGSTRPVTSRTSPTSTAGTNVSEANRTAAKRTESNQNTTKRPAAKRATTRRTTTRRATTQRAGTMG